MLGYLGKTKAKLSQHTQNWPLLILQNESKAFPLLLLTGRHVTWIVIYFLGFAGTNSASDMFGMFREITEKPSGNLKREAIP